MVKLKFNIAFIGFGTVGQGLAQILTEKRDFLKSKLGFEYNVVAISDIKKGSVAYENGLDMLKILHLARKTGTILGYEFGQKGLSSVETILESNADIIVEVTWTDLETGNPGLTHIKKSLAARKHVVTTNKGPIALAYHELKQIAEKYDVFLRFEGTVLSGTPTFNLSGEGLAGTSIRSVKGILNTTTNYILTEMERGKSFEEALKKVQMLGYAELDPTMDIDGWDATAKVTILANVIMDGDVNVREVERSGIAGISPSDILKARRARGKIRLVAEARRENRDIKVRVSPQTIPFKNIFAHVNGNLNALTIATDVLDDVTIIGPGAGGREAGYALLNDMLAIERALTVSPKNSKQRPNDRKALSRLHANL
jgi:homoserine dehydrogenase